MKTFFLTCGLVLVAGLAVLVGLPLAHLPARVESLAHTGARVIVMLAVTAMTAKVAETLLRRWLRRARSPMAGSGLIKGVTNTLVYSLGILTVLSALGVHIGPLLTALGVGGLAMALAFKDTAENMFSGIHLLIDRSVEVGDLIKIESGQEGIVEDIGWRTSRIRLGGDDLLIIPNTKLAQNITIRKKKKAEKRKTSDTSLVRAAG